MEDNKINQDEEVKEVGQVQIADDVIAIIAEISALEVEGMVNIGATKQDIMHTFTGKKTTKGIKVSVGEGDVSICVTGVVKYGVKIHQVCSDVQEKIKSSIETMTGLSVNTVDVHIIGVDFNEEVVDKY